MDTRAGEVEHAVDWDSPNKLSIVVQGALVESNMRETATFCEHWRRLFPKAEIVFSVSEKEGIVGNREESGLMTGLRLASKHRQNGALQSALDVIVESCDKIALARGALALPPIKSDSPKLNNMNLQIAAAKQGLALAQGQYVLRIRNDLIFQNRDFLDQYLRAQTLPRGDAAVFAERVMISWLYTLNPYTVERLPLHFSDWFHFGLIEDVRRIWRSPPVTLADSLYYRAHSHAPGSNVAERVFNTRLAVEQHLLYHCFKPSFPALTLDRHNDQTSVDLSLDILVDNFVVCDLARACCVFDKYAGEFTNPRMQFHCITADDWLAMAQARDTNYRVTLAEKIREARNEKAFQKAQAFPRTYKASSLSTREGRLLNDEMVAVSKNGVIFYGPYVAVPPGRYMAVVNATTLEGPGLITLKVTLDAGKQTLARQTLRIDKSCTPELRIPFDVSTTEALNLEVMCAITGLQAFSISSVTISRRTGRDPSPPWWIKWPLVQRFLR